MQTTFAPKNITVVGAGAIGGIVAAYLAKNGHDPVLVTKHPDAAALAQNPGLAISGVRGDFNQPVQAVAAIAELAGPLDLVFLATKATDALDAAGELLPLLHAGSLVVSLQNGICEPALGEVLGPERVVGCVVGWGATMLGPARLCMTSTGEFVLGRLERPPDTAVAAIAGMLSSIVPARASANILGELYSKLIVNACINSLGALTGLYLGQMLARADARRIFIAIMREAMAVADAMGLSVPPGGGGKLDYRRFLAGAGGLARTRRNLMIRLIGLKYRRLKSSTLQSLERGRPTEIDFLNGYIVQKGRELGVATPVNAAIVAMVKEIEAGGRRIDPANLAAPGLAG
ncbi:MAG: ketopantoate reductase family protein [Thermodesulfobacteriota bacterium]